MPMTCNLACVVEVLAHFSPVNFGLKIKYQTVLEQVQILPVLVPVLYPGTFSRPCTCIVPRYFKFVPSNALPVTLRSYDKMGVQDDIAHAMPV